MYGEKRARQIEYKARKQRESLAGVSNTAPLNVQVRLRAYCMIWELKQKYYKADTPLPYVSKASHKADEERIKSLEAKIIKGGSDEERAVKAVVELKEYLEIVAGSRVRDNSKTEYFKEDKVMSKNGNQKQVCVKFVRYFSVDKGSYSEEDLDKIVESNAIRMGKQLLICSEEHAKGSMLEPCGNLAVVAVNDVNSPESESRTIVCIEKQ